MPAAQGGILRLEAPGDEGGESTGFFLEIVEPLEVVDAVLKALTHAEHHGGGGTHAQLMRGAVNIDPVFSQALEAGDLVANFVIQNLSATAGDGIETGIAQPPDRILNTEAADLGKVDDLRGGKTVKMDLGETLLDAAQHFLVPLQLEVRMQPALHQHTRSAEFDCLTDFVVD